jgi:hypothetical protein
LVFPRPRSSQNKPRTPADARRWQNRDTREDSYGVGGPPGHVGRVPGKSLADFKVLLEGNGTPPPSGVALAPLPTLKKNYKASLAKWRRSEGLLNALYSRCEDDCVSWYAEATKVFLSGTAEGDMIREVVPTDYSPAAAALRVRRSVGVRGRTGWRGFIG